MQKYLFIASNEWGTWGGSETLWIAAAEQLARQGNEVRLSVPGFVKAAPQMQQLQSIGCRIFFRKGFPPFFYRLGRRVLSLPDYKFLHLRSMVEDVDLVVISQGSNGDGLPWMDAIREARHKYVVIVQCASEAWWPDDVLATRLGAAYKRAERSYFVSQANLNLTQRQFATVLPSATVIRNPFNVPYDSRPDWPSETSDNLYLACVARLEPSHKGQDLLLQVLALPHWRDRKIKVSLIGRGQNENVLRSLAESLRLTNIEFVGHENDIGAVWRKHNALVLPSRLEGMPLVVVEAMLCGRPCIATDVGGSRELIRDGVNGFLAKAATVEMLDGAMNRAWDNRARLREMGEQAAVDARQFVSADPVDDFVCELEKICNGGS
jgi:glycosyltransferase involved in cell wall biosynthesis